MPLINVEKEIRPNVSDYCFYFEASIPGLLPQIGINWPFKNLDVAFDSFCTYIAK